MGEKTPNKGTVNNDVNRKTQPAFLVLTTSAELHIGHDTLMPSL